MYSPIKIILAITKVKLSAKHPAYKIPFKPKLKPILSKNASGINKIICLIKDTAVALTTLPKDWTTIEVVISIALSAHANKKLWHISFANSINKA